MNTKRYLNQVRFLNNRIIDMQEELTHLRAISMSVGSPDGKDPDMKVQTSGKGDSTADAVVRIADLDIKYKKTINRYLDIRERIVGEIDSMKDISEKYYAVLYERHILFLPFWKISERIGYSFDHTKRLYYGALKEFEKVYGSRYLKDDTK